MRDVLRRDVARRERDELLHVRSDAEASGRQALQQPLVDQLAREAVRRREGEIGPIRELRQGQLRPLSTREGVEHADGAPEHRSVALFDFRIQGYLRSPSILGSLRGGNGLMTTR